MFYILKFTYLYVVGFFNFFFFLLNSTLIGCVENSIRTYGYTTNKKFHHAPQFATTKYIKLPTYDAFVTTNIQTLPVHNMYSRSREDILCVHTPINYQIITQIGMKKYCVCVQEICQTCYNYGLCYSIWIVNNCVAQTRLQEEMCSD